MGSGWTCAAVCRGGGPHRLRSGRVGCVGLLRCAGIPEGIADCAILWVDLRSPAARESKR